MTLSEHNENFIFKKGSAALVKATMSGEKHVPPILCAIFAAAVLLTQGSHGTPTF